jgi:hypothetical protein
MAAEIHDTDHGMARLIELAKFLARERLGVKAGILSDEAGIEEGLDASILDIAIFNEFGTVHIPERPFLRSTFDAKREVFYRLAFALMRKVTADKLDAVDMLALVGERMVAEIKNTITRGAGVPPPNAPSTIERKGSSRPLVDTGQLLNSITYEVVDTGTGHG